MDEDATGTEADLGPGHNVLDVDPAAPAKCLLRPRSPISATAELLLRYPVASIQYKTKLDNNEDHTFSFFSFSRMMSLQIMSE